VADTILDAVREKYPQYKDVPDDKLTLALGKKYPQYLGKDQDFDANFKRLSFIGPEIPIAPFLQPQKAPSVNAQPGPPKPITGFSKPNWTPEQIAASKATVPDNWMEQAPLFRFPKAVVADAAAGMFGAISRYDPMASATEFTGNVPAAFDTREKNWPYAAKDLPIDEVIRQVAGDKDEVPAVVASKISMGVAEQLPLMIGGLGGLPAWAQKLVVAGFTLDMARNVPKTATALGDELGKPKDQRDPDKISSLISDGAQQIGFSALGGEHLIGAGREAVAKAMIDKYVPRGTGILSRAKPPTTGVPNALEPKDTQLHGGLRPRNEAEGGTEMPAEINRQENGRRGGQGQAVAEEAQLPLTKEQMDRAESIWSNATDEGKNKLLGTESGSNKGWSDLTEDEQYRAASKMGIRSTPRKPEIRGVEDINLTGVEHPAAKTEDVLSPEHQQMLDIESGNSPFKVETLNDKEIEELEKSDDPFAQKKGRAFREAIATVDRENKRIVVNPKRLSEWLESIPKSQQQMAVRSLISGEETVHAATSDQAAKAYAGTLTGLERSIHARMYLGPRPADPKAAQAWDSIANNDTLMGHEALAYRKQQLMKLTPRVLAEAVGREKWTLKGLAVVESSIRGIRESLGTKASREAIAILDRVDQNIKLAKFVINNQTHPGAIDKKVQEYAEKEADELEKQAKMYIESGDVESGNELKARAKELRDKTGEQYFPMAAQKDELNKGERMVTVQRPDGSTYQAAFAGKYYDFPGRGKVASIGKQLENGSWTHGMLGPGEKILDSELPAARPKKRSESIFQDKFILPDEPTHRSAFLGESPDKPVAERPTTQELGLPQRPTGAVLEGLGASWMGKAVKVAQEAAAAKAQGQPKEVVMPKFKDFVDYMKSQNPGIQPGHLNEMWQNMAAKAFGDLPGDQLQELAKSTFSPKQTLKGLERIEEMPSELKMEKGHLTSEQLKAQSSKEGRSSIWDRRIPDKHDASEAGNVINRFRAVEAKENVFKAEVDKVKAQEIPNPDELERLEEQRKEATFQRQKLQEGYNDAVRGQNWRNRVVSALYRKMVKPQLDVSDSKLNRKAVTPDDIRQGYDYSYEDIYRVTAPEMEKILRDTGGRHVQGTSKFGRSSGQAQNVTKRLMVLQNPRSGTVHMVDVYPRGDEIRVLDPISPTREHVPLDSILRRPYRPLYAVLLDEPVRNFRQDFKNLPDYMRRFGKQAEKDKRQAESYHPETVSESEFIGEVGGRISGSEEGHLQGPHKQEVTESGEGEMERGERTPLTDAESSALFDHIAAEGDPKSPSDVEEAIRSIDPAKNRQAFSAVAKMGRAVSREYPMATPDELVSRLSERIYDAHRYSKTLDEFQKKLMSDEHGGELPMAAPKKPTPKDQAAKLQDDLFRLSNQHIADVEDAFPMVEDLQKKYHDTLPHSEREKVYHKLDEEFTLGHSDIKLSPNAQKMFDEAAQIFAENEAMYKQARNVPSNEMGGRQAWSRLAKDTNSIFQKVARGVKRGITEGNILSRSAWFTKRRVIKALTDDAGNRHVGVITPDGDMVRYDQNKATNLGKFAHADVMKRIEKMQEELAPVDKEIDGLNDDKKMLERTEARKAASTRMINSINKKLADLYVERQNILDSHPMDKIDDQVWVDKNQKLWKVSEATTGEIERNMNVRYHHEPFPILIAQNLKLKEMIRANQWLENFKSSPQFRQIARPSGESNNPPDWKRTDVPQFAGYVFEPRVADVLNQFHERSKGKDPTVVSKMSRFLMNAVFFDNPFLHSPNLAGWWFTTRGALSWVNPTAYPKMIRSFARAFSDVANKSPDYVNYLRAGTPLQYTRMRQFSDNVLKMLNDELGHDPTLAKKLSNFLGYANPIKFSQAIGHAATAGLHDVLTLQLIHEMQMRNPGMKPADTMREVTKIMPDYRVPARVLGSRWLSQRVSDPNTIWFGAYHYAEGKAFSNMAKGLIGGQTMSRGAALDKIAATAFLMYVAYPIMDDLLKKVTGRKDLSFRRAGPTTWPTAISDVATGKRTPQQVAASFISISPMVTIPVSLLYNVALGGKSSPIYNPKEGIANIASDVGKYALGQINQGQMYRDLKSGKTDWETAALNLAGIRRDYSSEPSSKIYGWAYDWAKQTNNEKLLKKFNEEAMSVYPPSKYTQLKNYLENGNKAKAAMEIRKLLAQDPRPGLIERELRPDAHPLSGLKETETQFFESLTPDQKQVYQEEEGRREAIYRNYLELASQ
jgi:hypothetical protein